MNLAEIIKARNPLPRAAAALAARQLTVGFIGGSITDQRSECAWAEQITSWLVERYPSARIVVENIAIGGTGSNLGAFKTDHELIERNCDIVFVEYAVNDIGTESSRRARAREGILRKLLAANIDVVIVYTYCQEMYEDMKNDRIPASIVDFEKLADHYDISSVWMGKFAYEEVKLGRMRWQEWLPDTIHPGARGGLSYAKPVIALLEQALAQGTAQSAKALPAPLEEGNWQHTHFIPFEKIVTVGPWKLRRNRSLYQWDGQILETFAPGAALSFDYEGKELHLGVDFGKCSADFRYRIDGGEWLPQPDDSYRVVERGWFHVVELVRDEQPTKHHIEMEFFHANKGPEYTGTDYPIAFFGVVE